MSRILVGGGLIPTALDTPLDVRTRIANPEDLANVEMPFVGMEIYCTGNQRKYRVLSVKNKDINGVMVANAAIDECVVLADRPTAATCESLDETGAIQYPYAGMCFYASGEADRGSYMVTATEDIVDNGVIRTVIADYVPLYLADTARPKVASCTSLELIRSIPYPYPGMCFYVSGEADRGSYMVTATEDIVDNGVIRTVIADYAPLYLASAPAAPAGGTFYYGYIADNQTDQVAALTAGLLTGSTVQTANSALGRTGINAPAGSLLFVLIPASSTWKAFKDDGVGGKVSFEEDNGTSVTIDGVEYRGYGEYNLVDAVTYIYVE